MKSATLIFLAVVAVGAALKMDDKALFFRAELDETEETKKVKKSPEEFLTQEAVMDPKIRSILDFIQDQYMEMRKKKSAGGDSKFLTLSSAVQPSLHYIPVQASPSRTKSPSFSPADSIPASVEINQELDGFQDNSVFGFSGPSTSPAPPTRPASHSLQQLDGGYPSDAPTRFGISTGRPSSGGDVNFVTRLSSTPTPQPSVSSHSGGFSSPRPFNPSHGEASHNHPPHIHEIDVQCAKDQMTINIEFDRVFNGEIYAKGYYKECRFVSANSGQKKFSFMVSLNTCGTQFVEKFKEGGQAYLENVLVFQNEPGIQEIWDTIRSVRCLWEGSIKKALTSGLSVDTLTQETVTFSGDTAVARLDIQMGRGPHAPVANGLVKIGEIMTLVVSVEGDPDFDVHVRDCVARDEASDNVVQLTDDQGCILKPKLFGAFQKTRDTGNSGASVMAYAYFQAFKFPEIMDLTLDCNVELCKTDCEMCPDPNQNTEPGRRRRSAGNSTLTEPARISRSFSIVAAEDFALSTSAEDATPLVAAPQPSICLSPFGFWAVSAFFVSMLISSCSLNAFWWLKTQNMAKSTA